jgi:hypothetical protein
MAAIIFVTIMLFLEVAYGLTYPYDCPKWVDVGTVLSMVHLFFSLVAVGVAVGIGYFKE